MHRPDLALLIAFVFSSFSRYGFCYDESPWQPSYDYYHIDLGELGGHHGGLGIKVPVPKDVMVDVINDLGIKLLAIHNEQNENNIAISPYGALSVLAALSEGVQGEAVHEIVHAAHIPKDRHVIRVGLRDIHRHLKSYFIPEEGFLAGLTLNLNNVTLRGEYEDVLRFYGFDYGSFNNALFPEPFTTQKSIQGTTLGTTLGLSEGTTIKTTHKMEDTTIVLTDTRFGGNTSEATTTEGATGVEVTTSILTTTQGKYETTTSKEVATKADTTVAPTTVPSTTMRATTTTMIPETTTQAITTTVPETTTLKDQATTIKEVLQTTETSPETTAETVTTTTQQEGTTKIPTTTQEETETNTIKPETESVSITTRISKVTTKIAQSSFEFSEFSTSLLETSTAVLTTENLKTTEAPTTVGNESLTEKVTTPTEIPITTTIETTTEKVTMMPTESTVTIELKGNSTEKVTMMPTESTLTTELKEITTEKITTILTEVPATTSELQTTPPETEITTTEYQTKDTEAATAVPTTVLSATTTTTTPAETTSTSLETTFTTEKTGDTQRTTREISANMMPTDQLSTAPAGETTFSPETTALLDVSTSNEITTTLANITTQIPQETTTIPHVEDTAVPLVDTEASFEATNAENNFVNTPENAPKVFFEEPQADVETTTPFFFGTTPDFQDMTTFNQDNLDYNYNYDANTPFNNNGIADQVPPIYEDNMANLVNNNLMDSMPESASFNRNLQRRARSVVDYVIARYYDDHHPYIAPPPRPAYAPQQEPPQRLQYVPQLEPPRRPQYVPQQEPLTFAVYGKYRESGINFMKYDTVLPFFFVPNLNALALSFPLDSTKYYLLLLLPVEDNGVDQLICDLRLHGNLRYIIEHLRPTHVVATIPSFMLKGYVTLTPLLQRLGIRRIFEPRQADFSPMTNITDIYVTNIEQAVTVTIRNYLDPSAEHYKNLRQYSPVQFKADHPFLYFVIDSDLHVALMVGKIINPLNSRIS